MEVFIQAPSGGNKAGFSAFTHLQSTPVVPKHACLPVVLRPLRRSALPGLQGFFRKGFFPSSKSDPAILAHNIPPAVLFVPSKYLFFF